MSIQASASQPVHRLDKALFWLRWMFIASAVLLVLAADDTILGDQVPEQRAVLLGFGVAVVVNSGLGLLAMVPVLSDRVLAVLNALLESTLAVLVFWLYDGAAAPLLIFGALVAFTVAYRLGWRGLILGLGLLVAGSVLVVLQLGDLDKAAQANWALSLGLLVILGLLGMVMRQGQGQAHTVDELELEATHLRETRGRARALYQMASTLSHLDYRRVLEAAQDIGLVALRDSGMAPHLISAVLLFQGKDNKLRVVTSRRLTRADTQVAVPGRRGVLGLALKQAEPVFSGDANRDPELRYFVAFQDAKSVLAIPLRAGFDNYGVIVFGSDQPNAFSNEHLELMTAIGTQATMSLQNAVLYQNLLSEKEKIVEVEEDARKKLSRDLHDGPTQSVAAIAMRVNYIRRLIERQPQQATEELWKVEELARRTTKEIRHMLFTLRPLVLETQGLIAALEQLAEKMRETHDTNVQVKGQPQVENLLDTHAQGVVFYIVEEAVNNARKHAKAETITVRLYQRLEYVVVEIEDNGIGFDVQAVDDSYDQRGSLGMVNMRERAELVEGTLRIQSAEGRGTKITILIPIQAHNGPGIAADDNRPAALSLQSHQPGPPP